MVIPAFAAVLALADVLAPGKPAPPLSADRFVKGEPRTSLEPGVVHVIEFWATWCGPCVRGIPHLSELQRANPDVRVVGIAGCERGGSPEEQEARVRSFVEGKGDAISYAVAFDGDGSMFRGWMEAARARTIPCAFVVGKDGAVAYVGPPDAGLDRAVAKAKAAAAPAVASPKPETPVPPGPPSAAPVPPPG